MKTVNITICKADVFDEIKKTSAYVSIKKQETEQSTFDRISVADNDNDMLERFWRDSASVLVDLMKRFLASATELGTETSADMDMDFDVSLSMSDRFDEGLVDSITSSMHSFFVDNILAKWSEMADKDSVQAYQASADMQLQQIKDKIFFKQQPTRQAITE